jgi:outer membrane protein insertion porin family
VERIEIHGNTRTRDYVIRREFDKLDHWMRRFERSDREERRRGDT